MVVRQCFVDPSVSEALEHSVKDVKTESQESCSSKQRDETRDETFLRKRVSFSDVHVIEFPIELGDNPSARGCLLTLGWDVLSRTSYDVDTYESIRPTDQRRSVKNLRISPSRRTQILLDQGHSLQEIASTAIDVLKIKGSRSQSVQNRKYDRLYGALVKNGRRVASKANLASIETSGLGLGYFISSARLDKGYMLRGGV
jgi:hypothetical protein